MTGGRAPRADPEFARKSISLDWQGILEPRLTAGLSTVRGSWLVDNFDFYPQAKLLILCDYRNPRSCKTRPYLSTENRDKKTAPK
jgi:hypothetical protein